MAGVLNPLRAWRRLRHEKGFGIHSPFAYNFITEVIHQQYAYYAYDSIRDGFGRLVFRVAVALQPRRAAVYGLPEWSAALKAASSKMVIAQKRPELVVADLKAVSADERRQIMEAVGAGASLIARHCSAADRIEAQRLMPQGMTFANGSGTLIAVAGKLPRQDFDVRF
mgnify:CR=1 FL=1